MKLLLTLTIAMVLLPALSEEVIAKLWTSKRTVPLLISDCKDTKFFNKCSYF